MTGFQARKVKEIMIEFVFFLILLLYIALLCIVLDCVFLGCLNKPTNSIV